PLCICPTLDGCGGCWCRRDLAVALNLALDSVPETGGPPSRFPLVDEVIEELRIAEKGALGTTLQELVDGYLRRKAEANMSVDSQRAP
ncbi:MAG: hypothetical protein AAF220_13355, partial [Pseudomonadota bacterium]